MTCGSDCVRSGTGTSRSRRVHIPKDKGKSRPIGVSAFEDKLVQDALREVLEVI